VVSADWTGTETYWTEVGDKVYTTNVGVDPSNAVIRYINTNVTAASIEFRLAFPDSDEWFAGEFVVEDTYATITKREIHIFDKVGAIPKRIRIDAYNGATRLVSYYIFRDYSDSKAFKYGIRVKHLVAPVSFLGDWKLSDDTPFADYGIVIEAEYDDDTTAVADFTGKTYYASIPVVYLPDGRTLVGGASDMSARVIALAALVIAFIAVVYAVMSARTRS